MIEHHTVNKETGKPEKHSAEDYEQRHPVECRAGDKTAYHAATERAPEALRNAPPPAPPLRKDPPAWDYYKAPEENIRLGALPFEADQLRARIIEGVGHMLKESAPNESVLQEADRIINGKRNDEYGRAEDNFANIAALWNAYLGMHLTDHDLSSRDIAMMLVLMKIARSGGGKPTRDNWTDIAGYAGCGAKIDGFDP